MLFFAIAKHMAQLGYSYNSNCLKSFSFSLEKTKINLLFKWSKIESTVRFRFIAVFLQQVSKLWRLTSVILYSKRSSLSLLYKGCSLYNTDSLKKYFINKNCDAIYSFWNTSFSLGFLVSVASLTFVSVVRRKPCFSKALINRIGLILSGRVLILIVWAFRSLSCSKFFSALRIGTNFPLRKNCWDFRNVAVRSSTSQNAKHLLELLLVFSISRTECTI